MDRKLHSSWNHNTPRDFEALTKVKGPPERHIEQLWDEIKRLKERIEVLEKNKGL